MVTTTSTSAVDLFDLVVSKLTNTKATTKGVRARCPAHDDSTPSLDVDRGDDGRVLLACRSAHCSYEAILAAIGLRPSDLKPGRPREAPRSATVAARKPGASGSRVGD